MAHSTSNDSLEEDHIIAKKPKLEIQQVPNQPKQISFPLDAKNNRIFLPIWFISFPRLEWDDKVSAAFCHPCRQIFLVDSARCSNSKSEDTFISSGFKNWKKAVEKFKKHESCHAHHLSVDKFSNMLSGQNSAVMLSDQFATERKLATECLERIFTTIRYLARQGLAIRGHSDSDSNFRQLLYLRTSDSKDLQLWLKRKTTWTSKDIQEEIIDLMYCDVVRNFKKQILYRKYFGIIADETADIS